MGAVCDDHDNQEVTKEGNAMVTATTTNSCDLANTAQNEKRPRRLWKSFSVVSASSELDTSSPGVEEVSQVSQLKYGNVVPALRLQLAEQGDSCAQVEVARELTRGIVVVLGRCPLAPVCPAAPRWISRRRSGF